MINKFYVNTIKKRFFNKIFLSFTAIIILCLGILSFLILQSITAVLIQKEIKYSDILLQNMNEYIEQKYNLVFNISKQAYLDNLTEPEVYGFLKVTEEDSENSYYDLKAKFSSYFISAFSRDHDIVGFIIYKALNKTYCIYSAGQIRYVSEADFKDTDKFLGQLSELPASIKIRPAAIMDYYNTSSKRAYMISNIIKLLGTNEALGLLMVDFSPEGITKLLKQYGGVINGNFLVLTREGGVIYDSSGKYYGLKFPYMDEIKQDSTSARLDGIDCIINTNLTNPHDLIIAEVIPKSLIENNIKATKRIILIIVFICILASLILSFTNTRLFSKRIGIITESMKRVRKGDFKVRIKTGPNEDEIGEIALGFNKMCSEIERYIEKVYLSEIKQKSAELSALQAQIDPHFLYNTLECIRMKAVSLGDEDLSQMIFLLGKIFRNSIKEEALISISGEIKYTGMYMDLLKYRFKNKLAVEYDIDPQVNEFSIIRHTIQPILENCIIHGFNMKQENNIIKITARRIDNEIEIVICDNGKGMDAEHLEEIKKAQGRESLNNSGSIGIANIHQRLRITYGKEYGLRIDSAEGMGTTVTILIPAKKKKGLSDYV